MHRQAVRAAAAGTNALRALLEADVPGTRVLMHVLGDTHSPPVDLAEVLSAVERHPQPALALASNLAPSATTALDFDPRPAATPWALDMLVPTVRGMCESCNRRYAEYRALVRRSRDGAAVVRVDWALVEPFGYRPHEAGAHG